MLEFLKRDKFAEGVWCIADADTQKYMELSDKSQAARSWMSMSFYSNYFVYFLIVLTCCFILKRLRYSFLDDEDRKQFNTNGPNLFDKVAGLNRYVSYRKLPVTMCDYLGIPSSIGNVIVLLATLLYIFCYTFIPHFWYRACAGFGSPPLAVRAGMEAVAIIPFIIMLSGKTNLISWLSGVSYEKLNVYHRWASMICFTLAWIHIIPFYYQPVSEGGFAELVRTHKTNFTYVNGIPPTIFLFLLCFASQFPIRRACYELFWHLHWLFGIGFVISMYFHVYPLLGSYNYMHAAVCFWFTQVLWRIFTKTAMKPGSSFLKTKPARARKFTKSSNECFELEIDAPLSWSPGQHVFVRIPGLRVLDNHPFSLCKSPTSDALKLIIKPKRGLTRKLYNQLSESTEKNLNVFIDGPYGGPSRDMYAFDSLYLLATGSGISAILPFLLEGCKSDRYNNIRKIRFDWIVKYESDIEWVEKELTSVAMNDMVDINIYCGSEHPQNEEDKEKENVRNFRVHHYKPQIKNIFNEISQDLGNKNMIVCSGSNSMKHDVGNCVAAMELKVMNGSVREIYLHTESFGW